MNRLSTKESGRVGKTKKKRRKHRSPSSFEGVFRGDKQRPSEWCILTGFDNTKKTKLSMNSELEAARTADMVKFIKEGPDANFNDRPELFRRLGDWFQNKKRNKKVKRNLESDDLPPPKRKKLAPKKAQKKQSEYVGVFWRKQKKKWQAHINFEGKTYYGGLHDSNKDAGHAVNMLCDKFDVHRKNSGLGEPPRGFKDELPISKKPQKNSEYVGVSWHKDSKKWRARISVAGKYHSGGYYESEEDAGHAANMLYDELGVPRKNHDLGEPPQGFKLSTPKKITVVECTKQKVEKMLREKEILRQSIAIGARVIILRLKKSRELKGFVTTLREILDMRGINVVAANSEIDKAGFLCCVFQFKQKKQAKTIRNTFRDQFGKDAVKLIKQYVGKSTTDNKPSKIEPSRMKKKKRKDSPDLKVPKPESSNPSRGEIEKMIQDAVSREIQNQEQRASSPTTPFFPPPPNIACQEDFPELEMNEVDSEDEPIFIKEIKPSRGKANLSKRKKKKNKSSEKHERKKLRRNA